MEIEKLIQNNEGTIVDVRTRGEFLGGHAHGSINIPLNELDKRLDEIRTMKGPLILCCASGGRSATAHSYLTANRINCVDGGSWIDVNYWQQQNAEQK